MGKKGNQKGNQKGNGGQKQPHKGIQKDNKSIKNERKAKTVERPEVTTSSPVSSSLEGLLASVASRQAAFEHGHKVRESTSEIDRAIHHATKGLFREVRKVIEASDVMLYVLDARDPLGTRDASFERILHDYGKPLVLVLNKSDLVPSENLAAWMTYLSAEYPTVPFHACGKSPQRMQASIESLLSTVKTTTPSLRQRSIGVVGLPNVGKSSLINALMKSQTACQTGATPGLTKILKMLHLDAHTKLVDSPGVILTSDQTSSSWLLRNCLRGDTDPLAAAALIIRRLGLGLETQSPCEDTLMTDAATKTLLTDDTVLDSKAQEYLFDYARRHGKLKTGGIPDIESAARMIVHEWNAGKLPFHSEPPIRPIETNIVSTLLPEMLI